MFCTCELFEREKSIEWQGEALPLVNRVRSYLSKNLFMDIIEKVKSLKFPFGKYVVVGSSLLGVLNIRTSNDLDIVVLPDLLKQLRETGEWKEEIKYNKIFLKKEGVDIIPELSWEKYPTTTEEAIASATIIEGVPFMNLEELCEFKRALGREKDFKDIELIKSYLSKISNK
jgi:hypothetical protein